MSCLYILEINPLSVALFANIFFHSIGVFFFFFWVMEAVWFIELCLSTGAGAFLWSSFFN